MKLVLILGLAAACARIAVAQQPSSAFDRGASLQAWQHADYADVVSRCANPPAAFSIGGGAANGPIVEPVAPALPPASEAIPGVIEAGRQWEVVWSWQGNNADGLIAGENGRLLFANNDASNVMQLDPATGLASILYDETNTGGALSRNK